MIFGTEKSYIQKYGKSFFWAGFFLPKKLFSNASYLYDFCRIVDNIADDDESNKINKAQSLNKFEENFNNKNFDIQVIKNVWDIIDNFSISPKIFNDLISGVKSDINQKQPEDFQELTDYSYQVAGTVGLMMAKIMRVTDKKILFRAIDLGIAMQLTNISRDVLEDSKINRIYIPKKIFPKSTISEEFNSFTSKTVMNYPEINLDNILKNSEEDKDIEIFVTIKRIIQLAEFYYESSMRGIIKLPLKYRFGILLAKNLYREIGRKLKKSDNPTFWRNRSHLNFFEKTLISFKTFFEFILTIGMKNIPEKYQTNEIEYYDSIIKHGHDHLEKKFKLNEKF
ncbi:phytoene/squalene synthase family protein [Candidatus Pelagibacter communis]|uniref:phytoene/squalene synthase family protein n=1 Tax=Pelagibacter ubique TaxID=198252 RepID=UPI00065B43C7|nr:phytoene/squalene synthase family protein [Candidatus Pelagibacter ubique]